MSTAQKVELLGSLGIAVPAKPSAALPTKLKHTGADVDQDQDYQRAVDAWVIELDNLVMHYAIQAMSNLRRQEDA